MQIFFLIIVFVIILVRGFEIAAALALLALLALVWWLVARYT